MKKTLNVSLLLGAACISFLATSKRNYSYDEVPYPDGYRNWTHVKTSMIGEKNPAFARFGGFNHIYANAMALEGYQTGKFPDGAILVFDVMETTGDYHDRVTEGKRKFIDVMIKDSHKYDSTAGWGFEEFEGDSKINRNILELSKTKCFNCHSSQKENDFVFSKYRD